jgi:uncharacterized protein (DUF58 family)
MSEPLFGPDFARKLERLAWVLRRRIAGGGEGNLSGRRKGGLLEFADHRDYVPGDDPRAIDWNAYARLDRLTIKLYSKDEEVPLRLLLDLSASMGSPWPGKYRAALRSAAALAYVSLASGNPVSVFCFREGLRERSREFRGKGALRELTSFLEPFSPSGRTDLERALAEGAVAGFPAGLAILVSDLMDDSFEPRALLPLSGRTREACVLRVLAPGEAAPEFEGDVTLVDGETGESLDLDLREEDLIAYEEALEKRGEETRRFAASRGIRFLTVRSDSPFEDIVLRVLREADWLRLGA